MPNQRQADKKMMRFWITLELYEKFRKYADALGLSMSEILTDYLVHQTANIELDAEDYERIAQELRRKKTGKC